MKSRFLTAGALALGVTLTSQLQTLGADGVILITTRANQDLSYNTTDAYDAKGPGQASQGDVAMGALLGDYGYSSRIILDRQITDMPDQYIGSVEPFNPMMVIVSGSSGSADVPATRNLGIPVIMGEHSCIGDRANLVDKSDLFMYFGGATSGNIVNPSAGQYMKVTAAGKAHPILQGIPLDEADRIKIFRDPYPEENAHVPPGGKPNYEYSWTAIDAAGATGTDTQVLGLLDSNPSKSVFGVLDIGGKVAIAGDPQETTPVRLVHWIVNEDGSGGSRRMFNALTETGRLIFIRTVKWALGETLTPVTEIKIKDITTSSVGQLNIKWDASALKNYKILATTDLESKNWQTIVEDIKGVDGTITRTLDITAGPMATFLRVRAVP
jgi:hypothetical protein